MKVMKALLTLYIYLVLVSVLEAVVESSSTSTSTSTSSTTALQTKTATNDLIEWISNHDDGYYNPKQEQRRIIGTTTIGNTKTGIYANEIIEKDEILLSIPWTSIIGYSQYDNNDDNDDNDDNNDNDEDDDYSKIKKECPAFDALFQETKLGSTSEFAIYLRYLNLLQTNDNNDNDSDSETNVSNNNRNRIIPTVWSQEGKDLVTDIIMGGLLPPIGLFTVLNHDQYGQCLLDLEDGHNYNDPIVQAIIHIIISSSTTYGTKYGLLIPFMDNQYYNHGSSSSSSNSSVNTVGKLSFGFKFELRASRTIQKEEQIVRSYNDDNDKYKNNRIDDDDDDDDDDEDDEDDSIDTKKFSTPELFRNYGIIEEYPQLYHFDLEEEHYGDILSIQIDKKKIVGSKEEDNDVYEISVIPGGLEEEATLNSIDWENDILPYIVQQLYNLKKLKYIIITGTGTTEDRSLVPTDSTMMTQYEWDTAWDYHTALTIVMEQIIKYISHGQNNENEEDYCPGGILKQPRSGSCPIWDGGYRSLYEGDNNIGQPISDLELEFNEDNPYGPSEVSYAMCNDEDVSQDWGNYKSVWDTSDDNSNNNNNNKSRDISIQSHYQEIFFFQHPKTKDMCMKLDDTVQQCTSYRPHYHEFAVHFPSRFLKQHQVKRVLFVGGGDSMVLHDVLKYPSLELVVGLELDQFVVRNSFRYFNTQPHFDDNRVEWWFGDGAKSLLMLPKSYFGSFDLVVVDLSETVMSFQVTDKLSIFQTLSLLLQPEGIMLKNGEYYMETMSQHFDYTLQYFEYDVPFICDQGMVIGSNNINFFNRSMTDHGVDTLVYESQEDILKDHDNNPFYRFTEYRKNNAREQGQCDMDNDSDIDVVGKQAGILMIVEAENLTKTTTTSDEESLISTLKKVGLTPISTVSSASAASSSSTTIFSTIVIIMEEGYITARSWPDKSYCALDIQLWGSFQLMDDTKDALVNVFGGTDGSTSSFRIVDGGMHGSSTRENDRKIIGPRFVHSRNCDDENENENDTVSTIDDIAATDTEASVLNESLHLLDDDVVVAVVCGAEGEPCKSLDALRESSKKGGKVKKVIPLWTCASIVETSALFSQDISTKMTNCEVVISNTLSNDAGSDKISLLVVDNNAQEVTLKLLLSIFGSVWNRKRLFASHRFAILVPTTSDEEHSKAWRRNFLVLIREKITYRPMSLADLVIKKKSTEGGSSSTPVQTMSVLSLHDIKFFLHLNEMISNFNEHTLTADIMEVGSIYDGLPYAQVGPFRPKIFMPDDYDLRGGKEQLAAQKSVGRQSLYQFEIGSSNSVPSSALKTALEHSISEMEWDLIKDVQHFADGIGDGIVVIALFSGGSAVTVWDGKSHIDVNLFSLDESEDLRYKFSTVFTKFLGLWITGSITLALSDTHPRGTGRVVSFPVGN